MTYSGWVILVILLLTGGTLFFSANAAALRMFSRLKLQEAFKAAGKENLTDLLAENAEGLILTCSLYRLVFNMGIILALIRLLAALNEDGLQTVHYFLTFVVALLVFSVFGLAVPHAWAKYAGEKILCRTYRL
ncbi:MAG: hypothetical protein ACYTBJ_13040, partial [Planctomycetota bacterium]